jgi:hypothetical protein
MLAEKSMLGASVFWTSKTELMNIIKAEKYYGQEVIMEY